MPPGDTLCSHTDLFLTKLKVPCPVKAGFHFTLKLVGCACFLRAGAELGGCHGSWRQC